MPVRLAAALLLPLATFAQPLPGTAALAGADDFGLRMVEGIREWLRVEGPRNIPRRPGSAERLREILGAVDARVPFDDLELVAIPRAGNTVRAVRWPVLEGIHGEGLWFEPGRTPVGDVVRLPDADTSPEQDSAYSERLAGAGYRVLSMALIDRADTWSGNAAIRMTNQPHREFIHRMAFPVGRHIIGYEVQKVLAAVDWLSRTGGGRPIGVSGEGEGGLVAFFAGALDSRIAVTEVRGYFGSGSDAEAPLYRNIWTYARDFGDAGVAALYRGRRLVVGPGGPRVDGPPAESRDRRGAAPGRLMPVPAAAIRAEAERARGLGAAVEVRAGSSAFAGALAGTGAGAPLVEVESGARMRRQFFELVDYTQRLVRRSRQERDGWWAKAAASPLRDWPAASAPYRERILDDMIGRLPAPAMPANPRTRLAYHDQRWDGYEVQLDVYPHVFAYGVLLVPRPRRPGQKLPLVVAQHGLSGRPQDLFGQPADEKAGARFHVYRNIGARLADLGFVVFLPQNPYIGDFRPIVRAGNPWGLSLYAFIQAQNRRALDWLVSLDFVDAGRIGYYGLSYGGKTALRIPPFDERFAVSICSGDFNEWIGKLATVDEPFGYVFTQEYDMPEWNIGHVASHAELAWLMAPRAFMVERGHGDAVGIDEWVAYEYARVRRFYDRMGIGDRTRIEFFDGPHQIHGVGTVEFLQRWLGAGEAR